MRIKKAKWLVMLMVMTMLVTLVPIMGLAATQAAPDKYPLYAGQNEEVGYILVWNDGDNLYVKYVLDEEGWLITETHVQASQTLALFPKNRSGNVAPGQFAYKAKHDPGVLEFEYTIPLGNLTGDIIIAAHAVVCKAEVTETVTREPLVILSSTDTLFWDGGGWVSAVAAWVHPVWKNYPDTNALLTDGAIWIWDSYRVNNPVLGDIVEFKEDFTITGDVKTATLTITADNAYAFKVNAGLETQSASLFGDWRNSDLTDAFVSPVVGTWTTTEVYDVSDDLVAGLNTLYVTGVNEHHANGTIDSNPGAVIYKLVIEFEPTTVVVTPKVCETAWAASEIGANRFVVQGNWATYIYYSITEFFVIE